MASQGLKKLLRSRRFDISSFIVLALVSSAGGYQIAHVNAVRNGVKMQNALCLCGAEDMTQTQLRQLVTHNHLNIYWGGTQTNVRYRLDTLDPTGITLTIVPGTPWERAEYTQVITYVQGRAFKAVLAYGKQNPGVASFINTDGNAVFYTRLELEMAYVGIKSQNFEVEIYSPIQGESLEMATRAGRLMLIK